MALEIQEVLQGRYRVIRSIKSGGMGAVYEAIDGKLADTPCAIKEVLPSALKSADAQYILQSFDKEMRALASLEHPNIPRVRDYFEQNGSRYIVLDLVRGKPLDEELREHLDLTGKPMEPAVVALDMITVLETLQYLHSRRPPIVHRDVKPANLIRDETGKIKLVDFGIAKTLGNELMQTQVGTPGYCAPEQMSGRAEVRSDIYSVGATLFALCTGRPPSGYGFDDHELGFQGHAELRQILLKATALKTTERYNSAEDMAQALRAWLQNETLPESIKPPTAPTSQAALTRPMPAENQPNQDRMLYLTALLLVGILGGFLIWVVGQNSAPKPARANTEVTLYVNPPPLASVDSPSPSPPPAVEARNPKALPQDPPQRKAEPVRRPTRKPVPVALAQPRLVTPDYPTSVPRRTSGRKSPRTQPPENDSPRVAEEPAASHSPGAHTPVVHPPVVHPPAAGAVPQASLPETEPARELEGFRRVSVSTGGGWVYAWDDGSYKIRVKTAHFPGKAKFQIRERTAEQWMKFQISDWFPRSGGLYLEGQSSDQLYRGWHIEEGVMYTLEISPNPGNIKGFYALIDRFINAYSRYPHP